MQLEALVEQIANGLGYELVDLELSPKGRLIRVFIDIDRGITVDDCATLSNQLSRAFDVDNVDYDRLEVSSPGLDRPLKKLCDFTRFSGQDVQLRTRLPIGNQRNFMGTIQHVTDAQEISLKTEQNVLTIPFDNIEKARLVPRL